MTVDNGIDSVNTLYIQQMINLLMDKVREVMHQLQADHKMDGRIVDEILAILKPDPEDVYDFPDFSNANISIRNARDVLVQHPKLPGLDEYIGDMASQRESSLVLAGRWRTELPWQSQGKGESEKDLAVLNMKARIPASWIMRMMSKRTRMNDSPASTLTEIDRPSAVSCLAAPL